MFCYRCGNKLNVENQRFCNKCGVNLQNINSINNQQALLVTLDKRNESNLYINYTSCNNEIMLTIGISSIRKRIVIMNGQSASFRLPVGEHIIGLKIGRRNYNKRIRILPNNQPVRIIASCTPRHNQIHIDQPY